MTFVHVGLAAAGLAAVAIPILIHLLFRRRRRPIEWGAMRFLLEAFRRQRRRLRLEQWLLLAVRCLVVALLALALARPILEGAGALGGGSGRDVYILIDNGLASSARDGVDGARALERHREAAREILGGLGAGDRAGLVTLGGPASAIVAPASSDVGAVSRLVAALEPTDSATDLAGGVSALAARLGGEEASGRRVSVVVLSDFRRGSADTARALPSSLGDIPGLTVVASPVTDAPLGNAQVVGLEPLRSIALTGEGRSSARVDVRVSLRRSGEAARAGGVSTVRVRGGSPGSPGRASSVAVEWAPGQTEARATVGVEIERPSSAAGTGVAGGAPEVVLTAEIDRDAIASDNVFRRPIGVLDAIDVGVVARRRFGAGPRVDELAPADWLRLALTPTPTTPVEVRDLEPSSLDASVLAGLDAVFVPAPDLVPAEGWARLRRFADLGGLVVVSPAHEATVHLWPDLMEESLELGWRIAREAWASAPETPGRVSAPSASGSLVALPREELEELVRPVAVRRVLDVESAGASTRTLLSLDDGRAWLVTAAPGSGRAASADAPADEAGGAGSPSRGLVAYLASAPALEWTDLPARPFMVPLVQEIVRQGVGEAGGSSSSVAGSRVAASPGAARLEAVEGAGGGLAVDGTGVSAGAARRVGLLRATDAGGRSRGVVAVNAEARGGLVEAQDAPTVRGWLAGAAGADASPADVAWLDADRPGSIAADASSESSVSLPLLIAALVLALVETLLARWFSHAVRERGGSATPAGAAP